MTPGKRPADPQVRRSERGRPPGGARRGVPPPRLPDPGLPMPIQAAGGDFSARPSPSPKWLQLSRRRLEVQVRPGPLPPPSRVCLLERKPAHLWNPSLAPRSASPTCPWGAQGQPPALALCRLSDYNAAVFRLPHPARPPPPLRPRPADRGRPADRQTDRQKAGGRLAGRRPGSSPATAS